MIKNELLIVGVLLLIETVVLLLAKNEKTRGLFRFLPAVFWIYFIPMLFSTFGFLDPQSPVYSTITKNLLPAALVLLLLSVDVRSIAGLGKKALGMMLAGSVGIMVGIPLVFYVFRDWVGRDYWAGFGALSGSWIGGSSNLVAVKEAIGAPENVFLPMIVVDTIVPYVWMGGLVALAGFQGVFDRWIKADNSSLEALHQNRLQQSAVKVQFSFLNGCFIILIALVASFAAQQLAGRLPQIKDVISSSAWTIILVSTLGLGLSFSPLRHLESRGSTDIGYILLYFVLTSIGAKASLASMGNAGLLIVAGFCVVLIHLGMLLLAAHFLKAPLFLVAVSSQANIGGAASAPIVAEIYKPGLAYVGLLMAIFGNIIGTYLGIITSQICRWVSSL